ncbi:MAG: hypothetical protein ACHQET_10005 [Chitinophagales bacterium]
MIDIFPRSKRKIASWLLSLLNIRTVIILSLAMIACYITIHFQVALNHTLALFSLVVAFPLVFSIQSAFKRRDRALEYLSRYKSGLTVTYHTFLQAKKLSQEDQMIILGIMNRATDELVQFLSSGKPDVKQVYDRFGEIFEFTDLHRKEISSRLVLRITRYMKDVHEGLAYLVSFTVHRTMIAIRYFAYIFIITFSFVEAPLLYENLQKGTHVWLMYPLSALSAIILITFYNVQRQIENPFDKIGLDDIQLNNFRLHIQADRQDVESMRTGLMDRYSRI